MNFADVPWYWTTGIKENTLVTIAVGGPLSIYLAVIINRLAAFRQIKFNALAEIAAMAESIYTADNCLKAQIAVRALLEIPPIAMQQEKQMRAAIELFQVRVELRKLLLDEFDAEMGRLGGSNYSALAGDKWVNTFNEILNRTRPRIKTLIQRIQRIRPDMVRILIGTFDNPSAQRRSDCGNCCENCNRTI